MKFAPDGTTLYAGTVGGLWRSPDKGRTWQRIKVGAAFGTTVGDVAINTASNEVIAGMFDPAHTTYQDGIWLSPTGDTDTFTQISNDSLENALLVPGFPNSKFPVEQIFASPVLGGDVYLAAENGVYVGTRSGVTFNWSLLGGKNLFVDDIDVDFSGGSPVVYAAARTSSRWPGADGIWKYSDGTWTQISNGITVLGNIARAQVARSGATLYARVILPGVDGGAPTTTMFRSDNTGGSWTPLPAGLSTDLYTVSSNQLYQTWPIPLGQTWTIGLRYESGTGRQGTASRFRVMSLQGSDVKGGNTFVLRQ